MRRKKNIYKLNNLGMYNIFCFIMCIVNMSIDSEDIFSQ